MPEGSFEEKEADVVVLIKASPEIGQKHGETVCVAGVDPYGKWHRLYPVPYKDLAEEQRFKRWDRIRVRWRSPSGDDRPESKRIDPQSLKIVSSVRNPAERASLVMRSTCQSIEKEMEEGRSLALIRPSNPKFIIRKLSAKEFEKSIRRRKHLVDQLDMFAETQIPREPPPYSFYYEFDHADRRRTHMCIDWETEQTFLKWRRLYDESSALRMMQENFGEKIPAKGMAFAMGTHRVKMFKMWLLSGIIQAPELRQATLF